MPQTVSACVIASNEQERLGETLELLSFCDEVIVVDGGSTDDTIAVARAAGATVIENPWPGFPAQRNVAIDSAKSDWILEIDADEHVTPELRAEIGAFLASDHAKEFDMGALPMRHWFLGKLLAASSLYPGYRYRFFRRGAYRHDETRTVHEGLWANDRVWIFEADIEHLLAENLREALRDMRNYARLEASALPGSGLRGFFVGMVLRPPVKFTYRLIVEGGWRDGPRGTLKIALDCWSDMYVWWLRARKGNQGSRDIRRGPAARRMDARNQGSRDILRGPAARRMDARSPRAAGGSGHHGLTAPKRGSLRIIGVGTGNGAAATRAWLSEAAAAGCDVAMITETSAVAEGVRARRLGKPSTLAVVRALTAENQARPYDAVLSDDGRSARSALRFFKRVRGPSTPAKLSEPVPEAIERIKRESRGPTT